MKVSRHALVAFGGGIALSTAYAFVCSSWPAQHQGLDLTDLHCMGPTFLAFAMTAGVGLVLRF